jgi:NAD(P)-dependent dehydrogenase (short-subunit alcohol dehydrogenase family)
MQRPRRSRRASLVLAGDESSFIVGAILAVDGGMRV